MTRVFYVLCLIKTVLSFVFYVLSLKLKYQGFRFYVLRFKYSEKMFYVLRSTFYVDSIKKRRLKNIAWQTTDAAGAVGVGAEMGVDVFLLQIFG